MALPTKPTGRLDTTITLVAVEGNEAADKRRVAARYVREHHEECSMILAIWRTQERNEHGYPVFAVEWEAEEDEWA